jgi:hypothetical protein
MTLQDFLIIGGCAIFVLLLSGLIHMCPNCRRWWSLYKQGHIGHGHHSRIYICKHCKHKHII